MSIEILRSRRIKIILFIISIIFVSIVIYYNSLSTHNDNYLNKQLASEEFLAVTGDWKVTEYLGEGVEYHEVEVKTDAQQIEHDKIILETKERYLDKILVIDKKNVVSFFPPTELGYYCSDWNELFEIYRQSPYVLSDIFPPFLCVSFQLKGNDDYLDIIMDNNGTTILVVKGSFFRLTGQFS
ncbi:hypothetical protein LBYZC6_26800 [Lacrimispora brassicae]